MLATKTLWEGRVIGDGGNAFRCFAMEKRGLTGERTNMAPTPARAKAPYVPASVWYDEMVPTPLVDVERPDEAREGGRAYVCATLKKLPLRVFVDGEIENLIGMYRSLVAERQLQNAFFLLQQFVQADRCDLLKKVIQKDFLQCAAHQRAVRLAMDFVELLPADVVDCRTYNMLATVCVRARDVDSAMETAKRMRQRGIKMDLPMYTNLILAHGVSGNVNGAFHLYGEMKDHGLVPDCTVAGALASVCANQMKASKSSDRRTNLVMLERASSLLQDLKQFGVFPDTTLCNVLVTCAGRAGQVQRAFELLQDMKERNCKADCVTYGSVIDACVKAERRDLGLKVYELALKELPNPRIALYTVALEACMCGPEHVDTDMAFEIYRQAERSGQLLDVHFFSTMIRVAGRARMPELAFSIEDNMRVQGIEQSTVTCSALISAALASRDLGLASKVYTSMMSKGIPPNLHQFTNLMQAYAKAYRFGDMVRLVEDMMVNEIQLDDVICDILLASFKDASMADLAFAVFTLLRGRGIPLTERICYSVLDICHIQIKALRGVKWSKPGHQSVSSAEGCALLKALSGDKEVPQVESASVGVWIDRSISIYEAGLAAGVMPSLKLLAKVLACLRLPHRPKKETEPPSENLAFSPYTDTTEDAFLGTSHKDKREDCFDKRVMQLIKEAVNNELVRPFCIDSQRETEIGYMPPTLAEAYVFTMMETLKFRHRIRAHYPHTIILKGHPFNPKKVMVPSAALRRTERRSHQQNGVSAGSVMESLYGEGTSLAVVTLLRRIRLWYKTDPRRGLIFISPRDITNWMHAEEQQQQSSEEGRHPSPFSERLNFQQRDIRIMHEQERVAEDP